MTSIDNTTYSLNYVSILCNTLRDKHNSSIFDYFHKPELSYSVHVISS